MSASEGSALPDDWTLGTAVAEFTAASPELRRYWFAELVKVDPSAAVWSLAGNGNQRVSAEVVRRLQDLHVRHEAEALWRESLREEEPDPPGLVSLTNMLAEPEDPVRYRVEGLWPRDGRVVLSAQHKAGKTTLTGNLIRSLVDGEKFLGQYVTQKVERVVLVDNELSQHMIRGWLRDQTIETTDAVDVLSLRGRLSSFNVLDAVTRERWAEAIGPADVLILDCLRPALDALALSEDKDAGRFLEAMDELVASAGVGELLIVHHMGHSNERSRGDSRILDWPDAVWKLVRADADNPTSERYFSAYGRDVDEPESRLAFDPLDRHLEVVGGSRAQERTSQLKVAVAEFVRHNPGSTQTAIESGVTGDRMNIRRAVQSLTEAEVLRVEQVGQARKHYENDDHEESLL